MKREIRILAIGLTLFAVYLPLALWAGIGYGVPPRPPGAAIEPLLKIAPSPGSPLSYQAHSMVMASYAEAGRAVILYENLTPLGPASFVKFSDDPRSFVIFSASDKTDPRTNGRKYWLVLPSD